MNIRIINKNLMSTKKIKMSWKKKELNKICKTREFHAHVRYPKILNTINTDN